LSLALSFSFLARGYVWKCIGEIVADFIYALSVLIFYSLLAVPCYAELDTNSVVEVIYYPVDVAFLLSLVIASTWTITLL
jgi:hypothetical protein